MTRHMKNRLREPSTHTALAVLIACSGLYVNSLTMEGFGHLELVLGWAIVHAVLGLVLPERPSSTRG